MEETKKIGHESEKTEHSHKLNPEQKEKVLAELNTRLNFFLSKQKPFSDDEANKLLQNLLAKELDISDMQMKQTRNGNGGCSVKFTEIDNKLENKDSELNRILKFILFLREIHQNHQTDLIETKDSLIRANSKLQKFVDFLSSLLKDYKSHHYQSFMEQIEKELKQKNPFSDNLADWLNIVDDFQKSIRDDNSFEPENKTEVLEQMKKIRDQIEKNNMKNKRLDILQGSNPLNTYKELLYLKINEKKKVKDIQGMDGFLSKIKNEDAQAELRTILSVSFSFEEKQQEVQVVLSEGPSSQEIQRVRKNNQLRIIALLGLLGVAGAWYYVENLTRSDDSQKRQEPTTLQLSSRLQELSNLNNPKPNFAKDLTIIALKSGVPSAEIDAFVEKINLMTHFPAPEIDLNQINRQFGVQYFHSLKYPNKTALQETDGLTLKFLLDGKMLVAMNYGGEAFPTDYPLTETELQKIRLEYTFTILLPNGEELMITGNFKERIEMGTNVDF